MDAPCKPYLAGLEENIDRDDGGYVVPQQQDEAERARERRENRPDNLHEPEHQELGPFAFAACRKRFDHRGGEGGEPTEQTGGDGGTPENDGSGGTVVNIERIRVSDRHNQQPVEE